jgi:hypothetical protein
MEIISDLYGITSEIETVTKPAALRKLLSRVTGKVKLTGQIPVPSGAVLQLLHSEGKILGAKQKNVENGICLQGMLFVKVLYVTGVDATPYACAKAQIPYEYTLEVPGLRPQDQEVCPVCAQVEQLQVTMAGGEEMDVKAIMSFSVTAFQSIPIEVICDAMVGEADRQKLAALPGMVIYVVKEGDNLWNIGKRYYVPVATLREVNGLQDDTLQPGQKLLIVRGNI